MSEQRDSDLLAHNELIARYGKCPYCHSAMCLIKLIDPDGNVVEMTVGCSNRDCGFQNP